ncbi:unnamed protein product [Acanthoscelides obtectus]|uniref:Protein phosphatase 1 regulatory subunit 21 N-terminal domain-containing protein n=1 Tax=Acanthoscelides obtectus TaxID=200917 RepID=A0A9P0K3Q1_ACAOB|nr:unnamed protein product [Acanthoscelides obtectus]CAK1658732.1 Protein phosphatase 1 regulatory subunit 21 [Acanthoscelides obtectus]
MDKEADLETKYQKLAGEYSKIRSQATVLKKAVLDEQTKNGELCELVKNYEQTIRKREQEMESLTFRNDQLTKRITVLQQELQDSNSVKKGKNKSMEMPQNVDISILNEELQKKILENAQLYNVIAGKDTEILECTQKIKGLEELLANFEKELENKEKYHSERHKKNKEDILNLRKMIDSLSNTNMKDKEQTREESDSANQWKAEAERWKAECELLKSKPDSNDQLTSYYETKLRDLLDKNVLLQSEMKTIYAENDALKSRLENITLELSDLKIKWREVTKN